MVDRHRTGKGGLIGNDAFMTLVKRVGRGSTAWFAGRDVLQTALRDSAASSLRAEAAEADDEPRVNHAGIQRALASWSDRVLGLSEVSSPLEGRAGKRFNQLQQRLREQAVSVTLTDAGLDGEVYLTMRDEASASSVVDVAEGAVAMLKLSKKETLDERHRDLLEDVEIERDGAVVRVRFSLDRDLLREGLRDDAESAASHRVEPSTRPARASIHRLGAISSGPSGFEPARIGAATDSAIRLSTALRPPTGL
jgi:hypothetical protein